MHCIHIQWKSLLLKCSIFPIFLLEGLSFKWLVAHMRIESSLSFKKKGRTPHAGGNVAFNTRLGSCNIGICGQVSIFDQHSIDTWVDTQLTLRQHLSRQSVESKLDMCCSTLRLLSTNCWSSDDWDVDQVLIKMLIKGIDQEYQSTVYSGCL